MFRPNQTCEISKVNGNDVYGKKKYDEWLAARVGVVKLEQGTTKTSVRTDSSASRGSAQEIVADARLMFPVGVILKPGDRVRIHGVLLTVVSVFPRHAVTGRFDHWQVDCNIYGGSEA